MLGIRNDGLGRQKNDVLASAGKSPLGSPTRCGFGDAADLGVINSAGIHSGVF